MRPTSSTPAVSPEGGLPPEAGPSARARPGPPAGGLSPDGHLLFLTYGVRLFAYGALSVVLGLYLAGLGLDTPRIGLVFTAALVGGTVMTALLTSVADRLGRRRVLVAGALLMALAGAVFALTDQLAVLIVAAIVGTISPSGKEVGAFLAVEQAILPQTAPDDQRTATFARYNLVGSGATALGALVVALPALVGLDEAAGQRAILWGYAAVGVLLAVLFSRLSAGVEAAPATRGPGGFGVRRSRPIVLRLGALFALDAFAGGFLVQSLTALWLALRFGADTTQLAAIFFATNLVAALSFLVAPAIARRIGLVNAMVFTHLASNVLALLVPLMPTLGTAVLMWCARSLLSQIDVPARQSYTMAIIPPEERAAAAGTLSVARTAATALSPAFAGATLAVPALGLPFVVAGSLKIVYDLALLALFRDVRPPEEAARRRPPPAPETARSAVETAR